MLGDLVDEVAFELDFERMSSGVSMGKNWGRS